jgi:hypothetical protein
VKAVRTYSGTGSYTDLGDTLALKEVDERGGSVFHGVFESTQGAEDLVPPGFHFVNSFADRNNSYTTWRGTVAGWDQILLLGNYSSSARVAVWTVALLPPGAEGGGVATGNVECRTVAEELFAAVERKIVAPPEKKGAVKVAFWFMGPRGPQQQVRDIDAPEWEAVRENYSESARPGMESLILGRPDGTGGRLAVLHGPPGTGKTTAVRALARSWHDWCDVHYVVDPEAFFGSADYMMNVIMQGAADDLDWDEEDDEPERVGARWKLVIVEDAEEFLVPDAKNRVGQALSRLLNLGDGMIGQGLRVLVLFTTNEPLSKMHPALTRSGRCFAEVEVPLLTGREASAWLTEHGLPAGGGVQESSIADLYGKAATGVNVRSGEVGAAGGTGGSYL